MKWCAVRCVAWVALGILLSGCDRDGGSGAPPPGAKPGKLVGKLVDASGKPLRNVTVAIFGFSDKGEPVNKEVTVAGPAGEYEMDLPAGKYNTPTARIGVDYNGRSYVLPLAAADGTREWTEQKSARTGMVRDFVWRISGPVPGGDPTAASGYWGGSIHFDKGADLGDVATIDITLTPDGPLIDGSEGQPLSFERKLPWKRQEDHLLPNVPLGRYVATAQLKYLTRPKPLRLASFTVDPKNLEVPTPDKLPTKVTVEFECREAKPGEWRVLVPNLVAFPPA